MPPARQGRLLRTKQAIRRLLRGVGIGRAEEAADVEPSGRVEEAADVESSDNAEAGNIQENRIADETELRWFLPKSNRRPLWERRGRPEMPSFLVPSMDMVPMDRWSMTVRLVSTPYFSQMLIRK
ncbi:uncharacterized protein N7482_002000 [Penicillium canariense]|uniref:Uncharacterized protein n=1 Tax=Penicillium canariense TaxID=189055 RepID=A0A9W9IEF3_9EURO|nr:uncharacterized protein N7482_002000 [Penicillium canariense]KAJ5176123.1 hypothetical protein N7482_002000 [Penicillium canariense]